MHISETNCQYLFGQDADQILFKLNHLSKDKKNEESQFIERCLELSMRVNTYLFTHKDAILLLDPRAFNKQCQMYALRACQINKNYHQKSDEEKMAQTEENRFLHLAFFLNYEFRENAVYVKTVLSALKMMKMNPFNQNFTRKDFTKFLRDEDRSREKASRIAFNQVFEKETKTVLHKIKNQDPFTRELYQLSLENLKIEGTSLGTKTGELYTYPKLAGLAYLIDAVAREDIKFVIQTKIVSKDGFGGTFYHASGPIEENDSVIVFGGFATDGSCSAPEKMEEAKKCPTYLYRNNEKRHALNAKCFYCTPIEMDLNPIQEHLKKVMVSSKDLILGLGVEFMLAEQKPLLKFFQDSSKYPQLTSFFEISCSKIKDLGLDQDDKRIFGIYHTCTATGKSVLANEFAFDSSPEEFLKKKRIIQLTPSKLEVFCKEKFNAFCEEKGLMSLSRTQRKEIISIYERPLKEQGFIIESTRERFKNQG